MISSSRLGNSWWNHFWKQEKWAGFLFPCILTPQPRQSGCHQIRFFLGLGLRLLLLLPSLFSHVCPRATPQTAAHQAPPSLGFSRQEHWSGLPFPPPMHESEKWKWGLSVLSDSSRPHGLQPTRLLRPWDFPARVLEWGAIAFSRDWGYCPRNPSQPPGWLHDSESGVDGCHQVEPDCSLGPQPAVIQAHLYHFINLTII